MSQEEDQQLLFGSRGPRTQRGSQWRIPGFTLKLPDCRLSLPSHPLLLQPSPRMVEMREQPSPSRWRWFLTHSSPEWWSEWVLCKHFSSAPDQPWQVWTHPESEGSLPDRSKSRQVVGS